MAERELFVICNNCGSEVSPYVTECPYCGNRLRKRAPDLKKAKKREAREERRAEKRRSRVRTIYEGRGERPGSYLDSRRLPAAITVLIGASIVLSVVARVDTWIVTNLVFFGDLPQHLWQLVTAPLIQGGFTYGFIVLTAAAMFGSGLEARFGAVAATLVWLVCGAFGVLSEWLLAPVPFTNGAFGVAAGMMTAWLIVVVTREDPRDYDTIGLVAVGAVLLGLPLATNEASVWTLVGGIAGGALCGAALMRAPARAV